jgi:hypothetical protein
VGEKAGVSTLMANPPYPVRIAARGATGPPPSSGGLITTILTSVPSAER